MTTTPATPGMGRIVNHDPKSRAFPVRALSIPAAPIARSWRRGGAYDQGTSTKCVAFTGKGILNTSPLAARVPYATRSAYDVDAIYAGAQSLDEYAGDAYAGTSGLGLCRWLASQGLITEYRWAFGVEDALSALSWVGPVGIGVDWLAGMRTVDAYGYVRATGDVIGGHEVELVAIDPGSRRVTLCNSWGRGWGLNGYAHMTFADLALLLGRQGDAVVIVQ